MDEGYARLAEAMAAQAVADLKAAYKKIKHWHELEKKGELASFVERETEKKSPDYKAITFTLDDASAVEFFSENSKCPVDIFSLGINALPKEIAEQIDFIKANTEELQKAIREIRKQTTKKIKTEKHLAEKERTAKP